MTDPYEREERIALISDGCKVSQVEAQRIYEKAQYISPTHYEEKVQRLRQLQTLQDMGKKRKVSGKDKAAGE